MGHDPQTEKWWIRPQELPSSPTSLGLRTAGGTANIASSHRGAGSPFTPIMSLIHSSPLVPLPPPKGTFLSAHYCRHLLSLLPQVSIPRALHETPKESQAMWLPAADAAIRPIVPSFDQQTQQLHTDKDQPASSARTAQHLLYSSASESSRDCAVVLQPGS